MEIIGAKTGNGRSAGYGGALSNPVAAIRFGAVEMRIAATFRRRKDSCYREGASDDCFSRS